MEGLDNMKSIEYLCLECKNQGSKVVDSRGYLKEGKIFHDYCEYCNEYTDIIYSRNMDLYKSTLEFKENKTEEENIVLDALKEANHKFRKVR